MSCEGHNLSWANVSWYALEISRPTEWDEQCILHTESVGILLVFRENRLIYLRIPMRNEMKL